MKYIDSNKCDICKEEIETLTHLFFDCVEAQNIWKNLTEWIRTKTGNKLDFTREKILFGYFEKRNDVVNLIINTTKWNIFKCKLSKKTPHFEHVKRDITNAYNIDRCNSYLTCDYSKFMKYWSICHCLFTA